MNRPLKNVASKMPLLIFPVLPTSYGRLKQQRKYTNIREVDQKGKTMFRKIKGGAVIFFSTPSFFNYDAIDSMRLFA